MAGKAVHRAVVGVLDHIMDQGAGGAHRVNIPAGVVTGGAEGEMGGQDVRPVLDRMAVGTWLGIRLAKI